jgi:predicted nucleic acid-binding protein
MSLWVVDASPLIFLAKLERLPLLRAAADDILVPGRVLTEIRAQDDPVTALIDRACEGWLQPIAWQGEAPEPTLGELTVIEVAVKRGADRVVLDDLAARRLARSRGLAVIGTLGLLLAARLRGDIPDLRAEVDRLAEHGFRASAELVARVLKEAGESLQSA